MKVSYITLLFLLTINVGCSAVIPWKKSKNTVQKLTWTGANQRAISWSKVWNCYSASGVCSEGKYTDHNGKQIRLNRDRFKQYLFTHLYEEMLFWGFIDNFGFATTKEKLPNAIQVWQRYMGFNGRYWGPLPYDFYTVSLNPEIILMVQNRYNETRQDIDVYQYTGSLFPNREALYDFFLEQTPAPERHYETSSYQERNWSFDKGWRFTLLRNEMSTEFKPEYRINYLETRDNKQFGVVKTVTDLPKVWLIDMRSPDVPPQIVKNLETSSFSYPLGSGEILEISCQDDICKTRRF